MPFVSEEKVVALLNEQDRPDWDKLLNHPSFTSKWVVIFLSRSRAIETEAIREIYQNRELRRHYNIGLAIVKHVKTPPAIALAMMNTLRWGDLLNVLRQPRLSGMMVNRGVQIIEERLPRMTLGERVSLARRAVRPLIRVLRTQNEAQVLRITFRHNYFTYEDAMFVASYPKTSTTALATLAQIPKWARLKDVTRALIVHPRTPNYAILPLLKGLSQHDLDVLKMDPRISVYAKRLIARLTQDKSR